GCTLQMPRLRGVLSFAQMHDSAGAIYSSYRLSPDCRTVAVGGHSHSRLREKPDKSARIWGLARGQPVGFPLRHNDVVDGVAFRPDGKVLATVSEKESVRFWDTATGKPVGKPFPAGGAIDLQFSPDGKRLALGRRDGIMLWDLGTTREGEA